MNTHDYVIFFISTKNEVDIRKECVKMHYKIFLSNFFHSPLNGKDPYDFTLT